MQFYSKFNQIHMSKASEKSYVKSTREGRLYIPTEDFFKQDKIKKMVHKLMNSSVYKDIEKQKNNSKLGAA